jgi:hypothetical protein
MAPVYVQYGCGFSVGKDWLNFDSSPTLRVERLPIIGPAVGRAFNGTAIKVSRIHRD